MASTWGDSWDSTWGDSLGTVTPTPTPTTTPTHTPPSSGGFIGAGNLLTPHIILPRNQWSKEEVERWIHRLKRTPEEIQAQEATEDDDAVALLLSLLI